MRISDWSSDVCSSDLRICRRYRFGALARDDADRDHAVFGDDEGLPFRQGPDLLHALRSEYRGIDLRRVAAEFDPHLRQARSDGVHRMVIFERLDLIGAAWPRELDPVDRQDRPVGEHQRLIRDELVAFLLPKSETRR